MPRPGGVPRRAPRSTRRVTNKRVERLVRRLASKQEVEATATAVDGRCDFGGVARGTEHGRGPVASASSSAPGACRASRGHSAFGARKSRHAVSPEHRIVHGRRTARADACRRGRASRHRRGAHRQSTSFEVQTFPDRKSTRGRTDRRRAQAEGSVISYSVLLIADNADRACCPA